MAVVIGLIVFFFEKKNSCSFFFLFSMLDMSTNDVKLFSSIKYFTTGFRDPSLETTFKQNGASRLFYLTETTTHVICDDFDSNKSELEQAIEIYQTPIVNSDWVSACLKCNSLLPIEPFRITQHLFNSCVFANANLLNEDHNKIYALVTYYGGRWTTDLNDPTCTHIICASALPTVPTDDESTTNHGNIDERLQTAYDIQNDKNHLITPDWIVDCINAERLLDDNEYHPDSLRDPNEPMDIDEDDLDDEQNANNLSTDENTPTKTTSSHRSQLIAKNFFNQADQTTPPPSADPVSGMNDSSNLPDSTDTSQTKPFPLKRPRARATNATPRQRQSKVNATANANQHPNQNGHGSTAKDNIPTTLPIEEKLIRPSISANFLANKPNSQTTRHPPLETLSYELNYSIQDKHELVPSTQCLAGCVIFIDEQEYLSLISKDELSSWSKTILEHGAQLTDDINQTNLTHFVCAYRTSDFFRQICKRTNIRIVTAHWLNDVLQRKKLFVPNLALHFPSPYDPKQPTKLPLANYYFTLTGFQGIERARLRFMIRSLGGKYSNHLTKWHTHLIAREYGKTNKFKKASQWSITIVNGLWLSELFLGNTWALKLPLDDRYKRLNGTPAIDHFSFDQIFVHEFLSAWSQPIPVTDEALNSAIHRHNEQQHHSHEIENDTHQKKTSFHYHQPLNSLSLNNNSTNETVSIMLSGFNRKTLNHYESVIKSLGGQLATYPHETTHLILNRFLRTEKLYQCMNTARFILNKTWLDRCEQEKTFVSIEHNDWIVNEEYSTTIEQSIDKRSQRNHRLLFDGFTFFLTPSIQPSEAIVRSIVYSSGGKITREYPSIKQLTTTNEQIQQPYCLILSCHSDKIFFEDMLKVNEQIRILSVDFLLQSILHQEILNTDTFILKI